MKPLDVQGILERAGADADAPEGSQAWALAQVGVAMAGLIEAARRLSFAADRGRDRYPSLVRTADLDDLRAALARVGGAK